MRTMAYALAALFCTGCATFGTHQTARPIDKGSFQMGIEPGMWHVKDSGAAPVTSVAARYGFGRRWDAGLRLGTAGFGVTSKVALTSPDSRPLVVAVAPSASVTPWGSWPVHVQAPLLLGFSLGPHELTVGPKLQAWSAVRSAAKESRRSTVLAAGVSVGGSVRIARGIRIVPEVTFVRQLSGRLETRAAFSDVEFRPGRPTYQVSLGVLLGGETGWWRRPYYYPPYGGGGPSPY